MWDRLKYDERALLKHLIERPASRRLGPETHQTHDHTLEQTEEHLSNTLHFRGDLTHTYRNTVRNFHRRMRSAGDQVETLELNRIGVTVSAYGIISQSDTDGDDNV